MEGRTRYAVHSKDTFIVVSLPIEIMVPESRKLDPSDLGKYAQHLEALPPIIVRQRDNERFELVDGYDILQAYMKASKREISSLIRSVSDNQADRIFEDSRKTWEKLLVKNR